jgi:DNA-binding HxlR family transcriptional regulator
VPDAREALAGTTRFAEFRDALGVAADVLSDRLSTLVDHGVMYREPYQEPGRRTRFAYHLTDAGRELHVVLASLQQWGDKYLPWPDGPTAHCSDPIVSTCQKVAVPSKVIVTTTRISSACALLVISPIRPAMTAIVPRTVVIRLNTSPKRG